MAVLVTRPEPDNLSTAKALQARGFEALLAPLLWFQALPFRHDQEVCYRGVIVTSANALRAIERHPLQAQLLSLPLFAVGERTADAARARGFADISVADGDAALLRKLVAAVAKKNADAPLLYLAAADLATDLATQLAADGVAVSALTVYRMIAADDIPAAVARAFADDQVEAVLHYSHRSARVFVSAIRRAGLEVAGLGVPQICISGAVARVLHDAGAARAIAVQHPEEAVMLDALERALRS